MELPGTGGMEISGRNSASGDETNVHCPRTSVNSNIPGGGLPKNPCCGATVANSASVGDEPSYVTARPQIVVAPCPRPVAKADQLCPPSCDRKIPKSSLR